MINRIAALMFMFLLSLFLFNSGDFHDCENDGDHAPFCDDCACVFCMEGNVGIEMIRAGFEVEFVLAEHLDGYDDEFKISEVVFDIDKPPRF